VGVLLHGEYQSFVLRDFERSVPFDRQFGHPEILPDAVACLDGGAAERVERCSEGRRDLLGGLVLNLPALEHEGELAVAKQRH